MRGHRYALESGLGLPTIIRRAGQPDAQLSQELSHFQAMTSVWLQGVSHPWAQLAAWYLEFSSAAGACPFFSPSLISSRALFEAGMGPPDIQDLSLHGQALPWPAAQGSCHLGPQQEAGECEESPSGPTQAQPERHINCQ